MKRKKYQQQTITTREKSSLDLDTDTTYKMIYNHSNTTKIDTESMEEAYDQMVLPKWVLIEVESLPNHN